MCYLQNRNWLIVDLGNVKVGQIQEDVGPSITYYTVVNRDRFRRMFLKNPVFNYTIIIAI